MMTTLREARDKGKLDQFAAEREGDAPGDAAAFDRTLSAMAGTSKSAPGTSKPRHRDG
jgi:hypothetical protein